MYQNYLARKERIMITAIDLLDEMGVNGLTTKEIARRQSISEPAIYKYFDGKKHIITEILERFSHFDEVINNTIIDNNMQGSTGILYFVSAYAEYYQNYPQIASVMFSFDTFRYDPDTNGKMTAIMEHRYAMLEDLINQAVENREVPKETGVQTLIDAIFGVIWSTTYYWKLTGAKFDLKDRILNAVKMILHH